MWYFEGTGVQIWFWLTERGDLSVHGEGAQELRGAHAGYLPELSGIGGCWKLMNASSQDADMRGLSSFLAQSGGHSAAIIEYFGETEGPPSPVSAPTVTATIVMREPMLGEALSLLRAIMGKPQMGYLIAMNFREWDPADGVVSYGADRAFLSEGVALSVKGDPRIFVGA